MSSSPSPALTAAQRAQRRRATINISTVVVMLVLLTSILYLVLRPGSAAVDAPAIGSAEQSLTIGPSSAPHTLIVYEDFLCPYCGAFEKLTHDKLEAAATAGAIQVDYRPFVLLDRVSDYSERATNAFAVVLAASGPKVALAFHDLLFSNQPDEKGPYPSTDELIGWAVEAGADEDAVRAGIEQSADKDWVEAATSAADAAGVQSTPTVVLNGEVLGGSVQERADAVLKVIS